MTIQSASMVATVRRVDHGDDGKVHRVSASADPSNGVIAFWTFRRPPKVGQTINVKIEWEET